MRLSEAIRLGAAITPQSFGGWWDISGKRTCALGSAAVAAGFTLKTSNLLIEMIRRWPGLKSPARCPACDVMHHTMLGVIGYHLNDTHRWSRERIADWVELYEPPPTPVNEVGETRREAVEV